MGLMGMIKYYLEKCAHTENKHENNENGNIKNTMV